MLIHYALDPAYFDGFNFLSQSFRFKYLSFIQLTITVVGGRCDPNCFENCDIFISILPSSPTIYRLCPMAWTKICW